MKKYYSFADVAKAMRISVRTPKKSEEVRKCRKCGQPMHRIEGTNVFKCDNPECKNTALTAKHA